MSVHQIVKARRRLLQAGGASGQEGAHFPNATSLARTGLLTGAADSKYITIATRFRIHDAANQHDFFSHLGYNGRFSILSNTGGLANRMHILFGSAAGATVIHQETTVDFEFADGFNNALISINTDNAQAQMYVNDVDRANTPQIWTGGGVVLGLDNGSNFFVGGQTATNFFFGDQRFLWMAYGTALDFSSEANRRKFFDAEGNVASLGANGELPLGTAPILYLNGPHTTYHTNLGTGGGLTVAGDPLEAIAA